MCSERTTRWLISPQSIKQNQGIITSFFGTPRSVHFFWMLAPTAALNPSNSACAGGSPATREETATMIGPRSYFQMMVRHGSLVMSSLNHSKQERTSRSGSSLQIVFLGEGRERSFYISEFRQHILTIWSTICPLDLLLGLTPFGLGRNSKISRLWLFKNPHRSVSAVFPQIRGHDLFFPDTGRSRPKITTADSDSRQRLTKFRRSWNHLRNQITFRQMKIRLYDRLVRLTPYSVFLPSSEAKFCCTALQLPHWCSCSVFRFPRFFFVIFTM
jgi:hypothetical protein